MTDENMSPAAEGVKDGDDGAKLDAGSGSGGAAEASDTKGSGGLGGAAGSGGDAGDDRKGDALNGSATGVGNVGGVTGVLAGGSPPTGANAPDVVVEGMLVRADGADELVTGVIVGVETLGCSSSSSKSSSSSSLIFSSSRGISFISVGVEAGGGAATTSSVTSSSSKLSSSKRASASSSVMSGKGGGADSGAGGSGTEGSPIMLRLSGAAADEPKLVAGVEKELEEGPTSKVDSFGVAGAPIIDVL